MFDKLRDQIAAELASHAVGVLSTGGELGPQATPVRYTAAGLDLICLVPRWAEAAYALEACPRAMLVVLCAPDGDRRWISYRGTAERVADPDWAVLLPGEPAPANRYVVVRLRPSRVDLIDQERGWGARDTLDLNEGGM